MKRSAKRSSSTPGGAAGLLLFLVLFEMGWLLRHPFVLWLGAVLVAGGVAAIIYVSWHHREQIRKSRITEIDHMNGRTFETKLALLFQHLGYSVRQTKGSGDFGADLVLHQNGTATVIQAKRCSLDRKVGVTAVQKVVAAMGMYDA